MAFFKRKSVIITICVLIGSIPFSAFSLIVVNILQDHKEEQTELKVEAAFGGGTGTSSDPYIISGSFHLKYFADQVNNGETYDGTYFKLTSSFSYLVDDGYGGRTNIFDGIGVKGKSGMIYDNTDANMQYSFNGHFDGNGHTISDFEIYGPKKSKLSDGSGGIVVDMCLGFFAALGPGATVTNLRLADFTLYDRYQGDQMVGYVADPDMLIGGIAGSCTVAYHNSWPNSTTIISGCSVENMTVTKSIASESTEYCTYFGGITGGQTDEYTQNKFRISDCYVKNVNLNRDKLKFYSLAMSDSGYGIDMVGAFVGNCYESKGEISDCVFVTNNEYYGTTNYNNSQQYYYLHDYAMGCYIYNISGDGVYLQKDKTYSSLSINNIGGPGGTTWYYASNYNDGYPYLRSFVPSWSYVYFRDSRGDATATENGVAINYIQIPTECMDELPTTNPAYITASITICDRVITAPYGTCCYSFDRWNYSSSIVSGQYSYIYYTVHNIRTITVKLNNNGTITDLTSFTIYCGTTLDIDFTSYLKDGAYSYCGIRSHSAFSFYYYEYSPNEKYYISNLDFTSGTDVHADTTITITILEKNYDSTFN